MRYILIAVLSVSMIITSAQHRQGVGQGSSGGVISGTVIQKDSNDPIEFANVVLYSQKDSSIVSGGITNESGQFRIEEIKSGSYYLEIHLIGYGKHIVPDLEIKQGQRFINLGSVELKISAEVLGEVNVDATVARVEYKLDRRIVNVSQDITVAGETAVEALENVPGVQTDIDGNVSLRGTESFMVLIDGRPSPVQGSEALQQIPAESIETIEIITNPSARYESEGVGGIINVVMKKDRRIGYNAQVSANYGTFGAYGGDFLVNIRKEKFNFFIGGNYRDRTHKGQGEESRITLMPDNEKYHLNTSSDRQRIRNSGSARVGMDYYFNDNEVLTVSGRYNLFTYGNLVKTKATSFFESIDDIYNPYNYVTDNYFETQWSYFSGDINYMNKFDNDGHELQVYASYAANLREEENRFSEQEIDYLFNPVDNIIDKTRTIQRGDGNTINAKVDYSLPINENHKFESGYQVRLSNLDNNYRYQNYLNDNWTDDSTRFNPYIFSQNVQSGYVVYSFMGEKFGFMSGLRTEYTDREFDPSLMDTSWVYNEFDFFPSVHASYKLPGDIDVMASYSRRLSRPRPWFLDPFVEVVDPNNVRQGNPMLEAEYTNSFELNMQKRFNNNFVSMELFYRGTENKIERYVKIDPENPEIFISTFQNIGQSINAGIDLMANLNLTSWWNFNLSGSGYYYEIVDVNNTFTWSSRMNQTFRIPKTGTSVQLMGFYRGTSISTQGERLPMYMMGGGVRQDLFDRKLTLSLNIRDIFNTMGWETIRDTPEFYSYSKRSPRGRTFTFSVTYRINDFQSRRDRGLDGDIGRDDDMM